MAELGLTSVLSTNIYKQLPMPDPVLVICCVVYAITSNLCLVCDLLLFILSGTLHS